MYLQLALNSHQKGDLVFAKQMYLLDLKNGSKDTFTSNFNVGTIELDQGNFLSAAFYFEKAIEFKPTDIASIANAAICHFRIGALSKAKALLEKVKKLDPKNLRILMLFAEVLTKLGEFDSALNSIDEALIIDSKCVELLVNGGIVLSEMGRHAEALNYFKNALNESPSNLIALTSCAMSMMELSNYQESLVKSNAAIKLDPCFSTAYLSKALTFHKLQDFRSAFENYMLALKYDETSQLAQINVASVLISEIKSLSDFDNAIEEANKSRKLAVQARYGIQKNTNLIEGIQFFRLKHDLQQANFLKANGIASKALIKFVDTFTPVLEKHKNYGGQDSISLTGEALKTFRDYALEPYTYETPNINDSLLNGDLDWRAIEQSYLSSTPELIYIDDFLTPIALHAFQSFSLYSKVWHKEYKGSYLGAFANQGFISPIHLKLAIDLKQAMPKVFQDYPVGQLWGFKYDAQLGTGINVHADFAKVNLNFWITPSECNLDPGSGGLKVYTVPAPSTWTFNDYNRESKNIYDFLDKHNSTSVNIPYRGNRAVLFNSALFHETDAIHFKEGYENRRVNMTYLFGSQLA